MHLKSLVFGAATAFGVAVSGLAVQAQDCDTITLGLAISLTGKYATNGVHRPERI